jgi:large subunit ribosomal protein L21
LAASFAVVETGGKQYRVAPGDTVDVEYLASQPGTQISLDRVLLVGGDEGVTIGSPTVAGASVTAEVLMHDRAAKIIVFKYKNKVRSRRKTGHRQAFTRLHIQAINA